MNDMYYVTVTDDEGCSTVDSVEITQGNEFSPISTIFYNKYAVKYNFSKRHL